MTKTVTTSYPKEKIRILFLESISDIAVKNFRQHGYVQVDKINKAQGKGVTQNNNQSYLWFGLAACSGNGSARSRKAQVAERLQPAELRVADRQVESLGKGCK